MFQSVMLWQAVFRMSMSVRGGVSEQTNNRSWGSAVALTTHHSTQFASLPSLPHPRAPVLQFDTDPSTVTCVRTGESAGLWLLIFCPYQHLVEKITSSGKKLFRSTHLLRNGSASLCAAHKSETVSELLFSWNSLNSFHLINFLILFNLINSWHSSGSNKFSFSLSNVTNYY